MVQRQITFWVRTIFSYVFSLESFCVKFCVWQGEIWEEDAVIWVPQEIRRN